MSLARWRTGAIVDLSLLERAAEWHTRMQGPSGAAARPSFDAWYAASDAHRQAYDQVCAAHDRAAALSDEPALLALRQEAFARAKLLPPRRRFG